jgi:hypothetical protein
LHATNPATAHPQVPVGVQHGASDTMQVCAEQSWQIAPAAPQLFIELLVSAHVPCAEQQPLQAAGHALPASPMLAPSATLALSGESSLPPAS